MDSLSTQKKYEEISFNNQCNQNQQKINDHFSHDNINMQQKIQLLVQKILSLERQLQKEKQISSQLQKRNQQLTNMLVSASQSNVKRNSHFIREVQRKIYNFKAKKELTQNNFDSISSKQSQEEPYLIRMKTQSIYESQRHLQKSSFKQGRASQQRTYKNKENMNNLNMKNTLPARNHSKNELKRNEDFRIDNLTQRSFNKSKTTSTKASGINEFIYKGSSKVDLKRDMKLINQIQAKFMRN